jgi:hypothetical protein
LNSPHGNNIRRVDGESFGEKSSRTSTDGIDSWRRRCRYPWVVGSSNSVRRIRVESISTLKM